MNTNKLCPCVGFLSQEVNLDGIFSAGEHRL